MNKAETVAMRGQEKYLEYPEEGPGVRSNPLQYIW